MSAKFSLSHRRMFTGELGQLLPCGLVEVLPGDVFNHSTAVLLRLSPLAAPVMHKMDLRLHHFFVPHRLTWEPAGGTGTFEDFITSGPDGTDVQTVPKDTVARTVSDVYDYLGAPPVSSVPISLLPLVAYNLIFNEWYRDQDLVQEVTLTENKIRNIAWEKDYLSSARPWEQKGPDITLPIAGSAPVKGIGKDTQVYGSGGPAVYESDGTQRAYVGGSVVGTAADNQFRVEEDPTNAGFPNIYADLSQAEAVKINEFRRAFALQRYAEARARYGSRYTEYLRHLGVRPRDSRLQRPEFLGGGKQTVSVSEVMQTAPEGATPVREYGVGDMYGHGVAAMRSNAYRSMFHEHGYVVSLLSVRPETMYLNGVPRTWLRSTRDEFWQRELQHIGQQPVFNNEVYADVATGTETFGYADRYREYREQWSQVAGEFRDILNYWHLGRDFATAPALNESFVECNPSKRIFNEQTQHSLWVTAAHRLVARRKLAANASAHIR